MDIRADRVRVHGPSRNCLWHHGKAGYVHTDLILCSVELCRGTTMADGIYVIATFLRLDPFAVARAYRPTITVRYVSPGDSVAYPEIQRVFTRLDFLV